MALPSPDICELIRAHFILLGSPNWKEEERDRLLKLLAEYGLKWSDLPEALFATANLGAAAPPDLLARHHLSWGDMQKTFADAGAPQSPRKLRHFRRLIQLFGSFGQDNINVAVTTRKKLDAFLLKHGLKWADLTAILAASAMPPPSDPRDSTFHPYHSPTYTAAGLVEDLNRQYVFMSEPTSVISSVWTCFTHVYTQFAIAPRLALTSKKPRSGKSTLGKAMRRLVYRPNRTVMSSGAALQRFLGQGPGTIGIDELDQLEAEVRRALQRIWNYGYDRDISKISLLIGGREVFFDLYAPMYSAGIRGVLAGMMSFLAPTQRSRTLALELERYTKATKPPRNYNIPTQLNVEEFDYVHAFLCEFARTVKLDPDPPMPDELISRYGDNARGLISVAESCSPKWGRRIREALMFLYDKEEAERPEVLIVQHAIAIFDMLGLTQREDVLATEDFDKYLKRLDLANARWMHYRGPSGLEYEHPITIAERADLLREATPPIESKTYWPPGPRKPGGSFRGFVRGQFEDALQGYEEGDRTEPSPRLRLITSGSE